ncbi:MAG: hypothetical protein DSY82_08635 [Flavobacteriia bacterium]|nr:MAG: hypothetical protein DSY82_08635 [Flavobacteriia bacterium]
MLKGFIFTFFIFFTLLSAAQINRGQLGQVSNRFEGNASDSLNYRDEFKVKLSDKTHFTDYKIISFKNDTTFIDTTLNISKYYKINYIHKDNFEYQEFENQAQPFTTLSYSFNKVSLYPKIGANAKHFNFYEVEDINYYHVPTPTTILAYRSGIQQGQYLDAFFTFNRTKQFNASIGYKGLHSLGDYRHMLSAHGNMRISMNYHTKNKRYDIRMHIVAQGLNNEENGGLTPVSIVNFESGDHNFKDRARLETNFTDAENTLRGNRYYFDHNYKLWQEKDSVETRKLSNLKIGQIFNYERKHYEYRQGTPSRLLGPSFKSKINDDTKLSKLYNEVYIDFTSPYLLGTFRVNVNNYNYDYSYKNMLISDGQIIHSGLKGNILAAGAEWQTDMKKFNLHAKGSTIFSGNLNGNFITADATYTLDSITSFSAGILSNTKSPDFNYLLFQSDYKEYNWQTAFKNQSVNTLFANIRSNKWLNASAEITSISSYTYFEKDEETGQAVPRQYDGTVNFMKIKLGKEFRLGKFALDNTFIFQNVSEGNEVFRVPQFITRNSLYFFDHIFKGDPLYLQTGITFKYFSGYYMNDYNPVLSEFSIQNDRKYGGYPMFDVFINAEISRVRLYLLFEHVNADLTGYNYYSAPNYPYRDFKVRFGLVWNFFI